MKLMTPPTLGLRRRTVLALAVALGIAATPTAAQAQRWALAIHGGAGQMTRDKMTPEKEKAYREGLSAALAAGEAVLSRGGSALDAVEATVRVLEDDPLFNSGRGAVFTEAGTNELDAAIMDGKTRAAGAIAGVSRTRNPISLARAVMERSGHVMLGGAGADAYSKEIGMEQVDPSYFRTEERWKQYQEMKGRGEGAALLRDEKFGTVGAVARDIDGNLAAATSTGGRMGKRVGRIGDSPVIGAGTFADNRACAVSATGAGEYYIRANVAAEICARVRLHGESLRRAADGVQADMKALGGSGGVIVVGKKGMPLFSFDTPGMYRGTVAEKKPISVAIFGDE